MIKKFNQFINEGRVKRSDREVVFENSQWLCIAPLTHEAARKYGADTNWCTSTSAIRYWEWYGNNGSGKSALVYCLDKNKKPANRNVRNNKIQKYTELFNTDDWSKQDYSEYLDFSRVAVCISNVESDEMDILAWDANNFEIYDFEIYNLSEIPGFSKDMISTITEWLKGHVDVTIDESYTKKGKKVNPKYLTKDKAAMKDEIDKHSNKKDDDKSAYGKWPADYKNRNTSGKAYKTKPSKATAKFKEMYENENWEKSLKNKAEKTGIAYGILKQVYNRGLAAWKTGHRPGAGQHQWAMGRVNSFATGEGGARSADDDLWAKHKKKKKSLKESVESFNNAMVERDPMFFSKVRKNPDFVELEPNQIVKYSHFGEKNRCENNAYNLCKKDPNRYFPVGGYLFERDFPIEHWWVYDSLLDQHLEVTPMSGPASDITGYCGVINRNIVDQIKNSKIVWDVDFFKSGNVYSWYFKNNSVTKDRNITLPSEPVITESQLNFILARQGYELKRIQR